MSKRSVLFFRKSFNPHTGFSKHIVETYKDRSDVKKIIVCNVLNCDDSEQAELKRQGFTFLVSPSLKELLNLNPKYVEVHGGLLTIFTHFKIRKLFRNFPTVIYIHSSKFTLLDVRYMRVTDMIRETQYTFDGAFIFNAIIPMRLYIFFVKRLVGVKKGLFMMASRRQAQRFASLFESFGYRVAYAPSGASLPSEQIAPRRRRRQKKTYQVTSFSRAQRVRGLDVLIDASKRLKKSLTRIYVLDDVATTHLKQQAEAVESVTLTVGKADLETIFKKTDVFVFLVRSLRAIPYQPLTVIEALNTGKPVVAANIPPIAELAEYYRNLIVVDDYKNPKAVAQTLQHIIDTISNFQIVSEPPKMYDWKRLAKKQRDIISQFL